MRSHQQRASRAFQFVPGHVGGRVASAQPVRRLGGISAQVDPEDVVIAEPTLCEDPGDWPVASSSSTEAAYGDGDSLFGYVALSVRVTYDASASATITPEVRVYRDAAWTDWEATFPTTISGPDTGTVEAWFGGGGDITDIEVRWDVADAFTSLCVLPINNE